jgi:hypothetical protein
VFALLVCITVGLGLASRRYGIALPAFVATYAGDTLWATMVFWILAVLLPRQSTRNLALTALTLAFLVEGSQLYHANWLDALRGTRLGALALGNGFLWSDLVCYVVGVVIGVSVDTAMGPDAAFVERGRSGRANRHSATQAQGPNNAPIERL